MTEHRHSIRRRTIGALGGRERQSAFPAGDPMAAKRLGGTVTTIDDVEHPLDRGEINDVRIAGFGLDPRPQCLARHGTRRSPKRTHIGRIKRRSRGSTTTSASKTRSACRFRIGQHHDQGWPSSRATDGAEPLLDVGDVVVGFVFTGDSGGTTHRHRVACARLRMDAAHSPCVPLCQPTRATSRLSSTVPLVVGRVGHAHVIGRAA